MPITRTPIVDDSGAGVDGTVIDNAWKQELYNQIDALAGGLAGASSTWTPTDASGAGLALTTTGCRVWKIDKFVAVIGQVGYPATANGNRARVGGLPFTNGGAASGLYLASAAIAVQLYIPIADATFYVNSGTGGVLTNTQVSGLGFVFAGLYLTA